MFILSKRFPVQVKGPLDVILLEGWMLGFSPIDETEAAQVR